MHAQIFHQLALAGDAIEIPDQQKAQQKLGINRGSTGVTVAVLSRCRTNSDIPVDEQQTRFRHNDGSDRPAHDLRNR